jgi:hypothetical protein
MGTYGSITITPMSSQAFWKLKNDEESSEGFLQQWLHEATMPHVDEHLDILLCKYDRASCDTW